VYVGEGINYSDFMGKSKGRVINEGTLLSYQLVTIRKALEGNVEKDCETIWRKRKCLARDLPSPAYHLFL
jgi:hypothetical protein